MDKHNTKIILCSLFIILISSTVNADSLASNVNSAEPNHLLLPDLFKTEKRSVKKKLTHIEEIFHERSMSRPQLLNKKNRFIYHWEKEDKRRASNYYNNK